MGNDLPGPLTERRRRPPLVALWIATLGALSFAATAYVDASSVAVGLSAIVFVAACGVAAARTFRSLGGRDDAVEPRHAGPSSPEDRATAVGTIEGGVRAIESPTRGAMLGAALATLAGAVLLAVVAPLRVLGRAGQSAPSAGWAPGTRLVGDDGSPVHVDDMDVGSAMTVFPERAADRAETVTLLLRVGEGVVDMPPERASWTPAGYVAFSKICTHAGCPVALYRREAKQLYCPCHQSTFDVVLRAKPVAGPATRSLPQLPLQVGAGGYLAAQHDYLEQVGPEGWSRT